MIISKITTRTTTTFEVYFERYNYTVIKEQLSKNTFRYTVLDSYDEPLDDDFEERLVTELDSMIG
jgi:hypothetical protein